MHWPVFITASIGDEKTGHSFFSAECFSPTAICPLLQPPFHFSFRLIRQERAVMVSRYFAGAAFLRQPVVNDEPRHID